MVYASAPSSISENNLAADSDKTSTSAFITSYVLMSERIEVSTEGIFLALTNTFSFNSGIQQKLQSLELPTEDLPQLQLRWLCSCGSMH